MRADGISKVHDEPLKRSSEVKAGQGYSMASDWTGTIELAVTEGYVNYIATGTDPVAHGVAEISGDASLRRVLEDGSELRQKFQISLVIQGRPAAEVKRDAGVWPNVMDEITDNHDVIGILFKIDEFELRRGYLYLHPDQFDKLIGNLATGMKIRFYSRQGVRSECDLIVRADVTTKKIEPRS
jgi:hypothetical protein